MAERQVNVVAVDPFDATTGLLLPWVAQRALAHAREHVTEADPDKLVREIIANAVMGNPDVLLLAFVTDQGQILGHALGTIQVAGDKRWVYVLQCRADENVGDAVRRAIEIADVWGQSRGAQRMTMSTHRSDAAWQRKYGFKTIRVIMQRPLGGEPGHANGNGHAPVEEPA